MGNDDLVGVHEELYAGMNANAEVGWAPLTGAHAVIKPPTPSANTVARWVEN